MIAIIKENTFMKRGEWNDFGWGNGYVIIPKEHKLYGKKYNEINDLLPSLVVNGGLTFSNYVADLNWDEIPETITEGWIVGFDTAHSFDDLASWPEEAVLAETVKLKKQLLNYK